MDDISPYFISSIKEFFLVLVVGEFVSYDVVSWYQARCQWCGKVIGYLSNDELVAMMSGVYGPVECFTCSDWKDDLTYRGDESCRLTNERPRLVSLVK